MRRWSFSGAGRRGSWLSSPGCRGHHAALFYDHGHEDLPGNRPGPPAWLVPGRRRGQDARPPGDADRRRAARKAEADLHPARGRGGLRDRDQRREDRGHRQQARGQTLLAPQRLSRRDPLPDARRAPRAAARGGDPQGGEGDAAAEPPGASAAPQAQGVRRVGASPPGTEARGIGDRDLMQDEEQQQPDDQQGDEQQPAEEKTPEQQQADEQSGPDQAPADAGTAEAGENEPGAQEPDETPAEEALAEDAA